MRPLLCGVDLGNRCASTKKRICLGFLQKVMMHENSVNPCSGFDPSTTTHLFGMVQEMHEACEEA